MSGEFDGEMADVYEGEGEEMNTGAQGIKGTKSLAAFIAKLYAMMEDPKVQHLIRWQNDGFVVINPEEFAREVLPSVFKHNNFASFVRQLNMYGFHKVNDFVNNSDQSCWEFTHPSFQKGKKELLFEIKRRVPSKSSAKVKVEQSQPDPVEEMSERIDKLEAELEKAQNSYQAVSQELVACKQFIMEQRMAINQIIQYLGSSADSTGEAAESSSKRKRPEFAAELPNSVRLDESISFQLPRDLSNPSNSS